MIVNFVLEERNMDNNVSGIGLVLALIVCLGLGAASLIGALGSHIYY